MKKADLPATKKDLEKVGNKLGKRINQLDGKIDATEKVLREEIKLTANETKEEMKRETSKWASKILNTFDKFIKEIVDSRQEREIVSKQLANHEERIESLERSVFGP